VLFVVDLRLSQRDQDAFGGEPAGALVDMLNAQSPHNSLYTICAEFQISLTQDLQFAGFFAATSYAAERKEKRTFFGGVH